MSVFTRLKTLWDISKFTEEQKEVLVKKDKPEIKLAKIVDMSPDPIEQFEEKTEL